MRVMHDLSRTDAVAWRKSSRSQGQTQNCVEVAAVERAVAVRDSKNPDEDKLAFALGDWAAFAERIRGGDFDLA